MSGEPKFKVGQIVVVKVKQQLPMRILEIVCHDGWFYRMNRSNCVDESMIRELTAEEKGE